jgi:NAD(P)-dependent dehydrogenase (short-subunit alcohol dehydrogenase family)
MTTPAIHAQSRPLPHHVAVIGAAGGLGQGILSVCRAEGIGFTAVVRSRPERITDLPTGSRAAVVQSLADAAALADAFSGADAVLTALGVTATTHERSALLSANMATVEQSMLAAGVDRIIVINTLLTSRPGQLASRAMRFFMWMPGRMGRGGGRAWQGCVFLATLDPCPGRTQFTGKGRAARGVAGLGRCLELLVARFL